MKADAGVKSNFVVLAFVHIRDVQTNGDARPVAEIQKFFRLFPSLPFRSVKSKWYFLLNSMTSEVVDSGENA